MGRNNSIWDQMRKMQEQMDYMFENFFSADPFAPKLLEGPKKGKELSEYKYPVSDIYETENNVIAEVEMPGIDKKDINVEIDENGIEIKGETSSELKEKDKKKGMYRLERTSSGFYRHFSLPPNTSADDAKAEYKNGILKVIVPKTEDKKKNKKKLEIN